MYKKGCSTCNIPSFKSKQSFERHLSSKKHMQIDKQPVDTLFQCSSCNKYFFGRDGLSHHKKICPLRKNNDDKMQKSIEFITKKFEKEKEELAKEFEQNLQVNLLKQQQDQECKPLHVEKSLDNDILRDVKLKLAQLSEKVEELNARCKIIEDKRITNKNIRKPTKQIRIYVYNKQNKQCNICKVELNDVWQLDHCVALQFGGDDNIENLQALCCQCHATKSIQENKKRKEIKDAIRTVLQY